MKLNDYQEEFIWDSYNRGTSIEYIMIYTGIKRFVIESFIEARRAGLEYKKMSITKNKFRRYRDKSPTSYDTYHNRLKADESPLPAIKITLPNILDLAGENYDLRMRLETFLRRGCANVCTKEQVDQYKHYSSMYGRKLSIEELNTMRRHNSYLAGLDYA